MRGVAPAGVFGVARVVAADAPGEVLRGVSGDEHGDARRSRAGERLACDRARVGVDDEGGHGGPSKCHEYKDESAACIRASF